MKKIMSMMLMLMVSIAIFAKGEIKTVVFTTNPQMHCENCENKIKNHLKFEKGIKSIVTSVEFQTVTITYDSDKTNPEKLQAALKKINYEVKEVDPKHVAAKAVKKVDCDKKMECAKEGMQKTARLEKAKVAAKGQQLKKGAILEKQQLKQRAVADKQVVKKAAVAEKQELKKAAVAEKQAVKKELKK